jgi:type II secretory pathway pseudopilin PulG
MNQQPAFHPVRGGFSMIEMLFVLIIIIIVSSMGVMNLLVQLRRAAVGTSASDIVVASDLARQLAMYENGTGDTFYGVQVVDDPAEGKAYVAVVSGSKSRIPTTHLTTEGVPLYRSELPGSVIIWSGASDLQSRGRRIAWYFRNGVGDVCGLDATTADGLTEYSYSVGMPRRADYAMIYGVDYSAGQPDVCPGETDAAGFYHPGLSLRSTDNRYRSMVGVYPNGVAYSIDFSQNLAQND